MVQKLAYPRMLQIASPSPTGCTQGCWFYLQSWWTIALMEKLTKDAQILHYPKRNNNFSNVLHPFTEYIKIKGPWLATTHLSWAAVHKHYWIVMYLRRTIVRNYNAVFWILALSPPFSLPCFLFFNSLPFLLLLFVYYKMKIKTITPPKLELESRVTSWTHPGLCHLMVLFPAQLDKCLHSHNCLQKGVLSRHE